MCINCGPTFGCVKGCSVNPDGREPEAWEKAILDQEVGRKGYQVVVLPVVQARLEAWLTSQGMYLFGIPSNAGDLPTFGIGAK